MATATPEIPTPSRPAALPDSGAVPVAKVCWAAKLGVGAQAVVVLSSTDTVLPFSSATSRSGLPSPLTSAAVTEAGPLPVAKVCWAAKLGVAAPGAVVLSSTDTVPSLLFATIRSALPSPLTSAAVTEAGRLPVAKVRWAGSQGGRAAEEGGLRSSANLLKISFATIRAGLP